MPPVASTTARARISTPVVLGEHARDRVRPRTGSAPAAASPCRISTPSRSCGSAQRAMTSAPVASPPACTTRRRGGRLRACATAPRSARGRSRAPSAISSATRCGPSSTRIRTASGSHAPRAGDQRCRARGRRGRRSPNAAAMPPCAHGVLPSPGVERRARCGSAADRARSTVRRHRQPMTRTSTRAAHSPPPG